MPAFVNVLDYSMVDACILVRIWKLDRPPEAGFTTFTIDTVCSAVLMPRG